MKTLAPVGRESTTNDPDLVDIVFADIAGTDDNARDAKHSARSAYLVNSSRLTITKGYYENTLDTHLPKTKVALAHIDCDLYSSAKYVLDKLLARGLLQDGEAAGRRGRIDAQGCQRSGSCFRHHRAPVRTRSPPDPRRRARG